MNNPRFEIRPAADGGWHFILKAGNGECVLQSETYVKKESAEKTVKMIKKNAADAEIIYPEK